MDPFSLLGIPRRPLVAEEELGSAYRQLAGRLHPDQPNGDEVAFRQLGEAVTILRDPARRLRELAGSGPSSTLPPEAAGLFPSIATLLREADTLMEKRTAASSPLTKAVLAAPLKTLGCNLDAMLVSLVEWKTSLDRELSALNASWPSQNTDTMSQLADSYSYQGKWDAQLRERKLALESLLG